MSVDCDVRAIAPTGAGSEMGAEVEEAVGMGVRVGSGDPPFID